MGLQSLLRTIYPPMCLICSARVLDEFALCGRCMGSVPFAAGLSCDRCAAPLPGHSDHRELCDACLEDPPPWQQARAILRYDKGARDLILPFKNADRTDLARPLGTWLAQACEAIMGEDCLIAPVPLHWSRMLHRKYNQSALLARFMAQTSGRVLCNDLLQRTRRTRKLGTLRPEERARILDGAIRLRRPERAKGRDILLVDDVLTTGATLRQCSEACLAGGARSVRIAVLARTGGTA